MSLIILGAGLAGLSAAFHSKKRCFLYEKELVIGGTCRSFINNGFTFDLGIHVLHTKDKYVLKLILNNKKLKLKKKRRSAWIYSHNTITKYPFQVNTYGLPQHIIDKCVLGFKKIYGKSCVEHKNYKEWIYAVFGKGIAESFYIPYSNKFWTYKAKEITTDWLDVRVPRPKLEQVLQGAASVHKEEFGPNAEFLYPLHNGIQGIAEVFCTSKVSSVLNLGMEAERIDSEARIVYFKNKTSVKYTQLISSIPMPDIIKIIDNVPCAVSKAAEGLKYNSVVCVNIGIKRSDLNDKHWLYFVEDNFLPFRISFPMNFSRFTVPNGWSSIQAEISYSKVKPLNLHNIAQKVVKDLLAAGVISSSDKIKLIGISDIKYAYVVYDHMRKINIDIIQEFLKSRNITSIGRYGKWEYLWMDQAILSGKEAVSNI